MLALGFLSPSSGYHRVTVPAYWLPSLFALPVNLTQPRVTREANLAEGSPILAWPVSIFMWDYFNYVDCYRKPQPIVGGTILSVVIPELCKSVGMALSTVSR